jgi:hypothetical protein
VGDDNERCREFVQVPTGVRGDGEVPFGVDRLLPGNSNDAEFVEQFRDAGRDRRGVGTGEHQLHAEIGIEEVDKVEEPVRRGNCVHDEQHLLGVGDS